VSVEGNIATVRALAEAVSKPDWVTFEALIDSNCEWTSVASGRVMRGVRELLDGWRAMAEAFPDLSVEIVTIIGQGELVANEWSAGGTHLGPLPRPDGGEYRPTGRAFTRRGVGVVEFRDGRVVRYRDYFDRQTLSEQLQLE
jgi:steroid delta-isomerase-like uncharacterized protein